MVNMAGIVMAPELLPAAGQSGRSGRNEAKRAKHRSGAPLFYHFGKTARGITPLKSRACRPSCYLLNIISVMLNTSPNACTMQNFTPLFPREFAAPTPTPRGGRVAPPLTAPRNFWRSQTILASEG